jgi:predicted ATPase
MRIDAIHLDHWLSYETFAWEELDPHLNVIVGPNGVGKTNLFHAVEAVRDALGLERAQATERWVDAGYRGADADMMTIALDLQFTAEWEQRLLCTFLANVLCDQQEIQQVVTTATQRNLDSDRLRRFAAWVQEQLHPDGISWFFRGRLVATHVGRLGWQCRYEALPGNSA